MTTVSSELYLEEEIKDYIGTGLVATSLWPAFYEPIISIPGTNNINLIIVLKEPKMLEIRKRHNPIIRNNEYKKTKKKQDIPQFANSIVR